MCSRSNFLFRWNINQLRLRNPDERLQAIIDAMVIGPADVENVDVEEILGVRAEEYLRSKFKDRRNGQSNKIGDAFAHIFILGSMGREGVTFQLINKNSIARIGTRHGRGSTARWPTPITTAGRTRRSDGCRFVKSSLSATQRPI